jgi:hypothetical protein
VKTKLIFLILLQWPLWGCAKFYSAEAIEGRVVDRNGPLEGVIVVAYWQVEGGFMQPRPLSQLRIIEAVTDKEGRYAFPAWGPAVVMRGDLGSRAPGLVLFKPGYTPRQLGVSKDFPHQKTILLETFNGSLESYATELWWLNHTLLKVGFEIGESSGDYCGWKSFPMMLRALDGQSARFRAANVRANTLADDLKANDAELVRRGCGSVREALQVGTK